MARDASQSDQLSNVRRGDTQCVTATTGGSVGELKSRAEPSSDSRQVCDSQGDLSGG
jgi:hypothetical protein